MIVSSKGRVILVIQVSTVKGFKRLVALRDGFKPTSQSEDEGAEVVVVNHF